MSHNHSATTDKNIMVADKFDCRSDLILPRVIVGLVIVASVVGQLRAQSDSNGGPAFDDQQNMKDQLGIKLLRPGAKPDDPSTYDEANANRLCDSMPEALTRIDGSVVSRPDQWPQRRAEIVEIFEREIYGRVPTTVPKVTWEVIQTTEGEQGGVATVTKKLLGHVDNSDYPQVTVNIEANVTVIADDNKLRPIMIEFGGFGRRRDQQRGGNPWTEQAIAHGWAFGSINPASIQPDNKNFRAGIIGLTNKGQPRKPDDWGALRAWGWGIGQLIDFFAAHPEFKVDPTKVGIEGVSRYGKAALVTQAFDPRVAVAFVASSGEGGAKLHRHIFGERVENLTGGGYYWMAGNFMKYGAEEADFGRKTAADLPVDSHELIALCAPRPCFISYGTVEGGDPHWVDARGSFMAGVLAGPVYELLGAHGFGTSGDYLKDSMPSVNTLVGGELAWRQHDGGHEATPNWPAFFDWVAQYIPAPPPPKATSTSANRDNSPPPALTADQPAARGDQNSQLAHAELLKKAKSDGIDVYFVGDSITRRWGTSDAQYRAFLDNWRKNFYGWNAGNFGWGGDTTQNILWRLANGELDGVNPKVIVILAGTNNIGTQPGDKAKVDDVVRGVTAIVATCRQKAPNAVIVLTAIFPRNDNVAVLPTINQINEQLARLADDKVRFLNVNAKLADESGRLREGMMGDGLHPTVQGYQIWADGLKPILTEVLGPPADTDQAPPPTGDPSAAR